MPILADIQSAAIIRSGFKIVGAGYRDGNETFPEESKIVIAFSRCKTDVVSATSGNRP
jgi:hypothetical protein